MSMQENSVRFVGFDIKEGEVKFICNDVKDSVERSLELYFRFNKPIIPSNNAIAVALSAMCHNTIYGNIYIDLSISAKVLETIKKYNKANVTCKNIIESEAAIEKGSVYALSFSGGFDSLAVLCLLPDNIKLISASFEGFKERDFFSLFNPYIVETNFRKHGFRPASGALGIGSILYKDALSIKDILFGNVLESAPVVLGKHKIGDPPRSHVWPAEAYNLKNFNITHGLSEVATTMVACYYKPEYIKQSLDSLANPGTEKKYRKQLLVGLAASKLNLKIDIGDKELPSDKNISSFGDYMASDFLSFYFVKKLGMDAASKYLVNIPNEVPDLIKNMNLSFYERLNTNHLAQVPLDLRGIFLSRLSEVGIIPYDERDFIEFRTIVNYMAEHCEYFKTGAAHR